MELRHAVITSVTRDDLPDRGAAHWAAVVRAVRETCPDTTIEVLIPDFGGRTDLLDVVLQARPDITGHNIETVARLTPSVRSRARYEVSLDVLRHIASAGQRGGAAGTPLSRQIAKSGIMVGLGESPGEVLAALDDLREAGVSIVTLGQYLRPTLAHLPVADYVTPEMFEFYKREALARGFSHVASGPLVRSSYMAEAALERLEV
jgi:lipoic acid synthetase